MSDEIRIGIVGLGDNTRNRHVPGLLACENVSIQGVCNRSTESSQRAAHEFGIPTTYRSWEALVADDSIDTVVIGTWPYLHCPITLAALAAGKHVLTEARMAMNADEARQMLAASQQHPELVTQIVPSPLGLSGHQVVEQLIADDLGELREVAVLCTAGTAADSQAPFHWRQSAAFSGLNMLALGIIHEPLIRWIPDPIRVQAQTHIFTPQRPDSETGQLHEVGTPDLVHVLTELPGGARGIYHLSGVAHFGPQPQIHLYGTHGTLKYVFAPREQIYFGRSGDTALSEVAVPDERSGGWRVEEEFINAIRGVEPVRFNDFATGVRYMEFTQAVADSAASGRAVALEG